ncbi:hypothetical protein N9W85_01280, partial [Flavobacteriaceae bacterium]|nr:hypothetical protein [Flavobacteriaceae bacterium]
KKNWTVSQDVYDENYSFIVIHGIRDLQEIESLKANQSIKDQLSLETLDNFVTLASQYRTYLKNKSWKSEAR